MFTADQLQKIDKTYTAIKVWFDGFVEEDLAHLHKMVSNAKMLLSYQSVFTHKRILHNPRQNISILATGLNTGTDNHELHWLAIRELKDNFGNILIKPDYLSDKLAEFFDIALINPENNPEFSVKYHFSSTAPARAVEFATHERLKVIEKVDDLMIEVNENILIARCMRKLKPADCVNLVSVVSHL